MKISENKERGHKISIALTGRKNYWMDVKGDKNPSKKIEVREKISNTRKKLLLEGKVKSTTYISSLEKILHKNLEKEGIKFEVTKLIVGEPDIFIEPNICIFVDGCYWHGCEQCFDRNKLDKRQIKSKARDLFVTHYLQNKSYIVLRFWEHDIKKDIDYILHKIKRVVEEYKIRGDCYNDNN